MPRRPIFRSLFAALTMAALALCGGGKVQASERGTASAVEVRSGPATRADSRKRCAEAVVAVVEGSAEIWAAPASADRNGLHADPATPIIATATPPVPVIRPALPRFQGQGAKQPLRPRSRAPPALG